MSRAGFVRSLGAVLLCASRLLAQPSPFFCTEYPNEGFNCIEHGNILDRSSVLCPDPLEDPWCACIETYFSTNAPGERPTITQEALYRQAQPTASDYFVDVSGGTLDLSSVKVGDVVFNFLVCIDKDAVSAAIGQPSPLPFKLDFQAVVTAKHASFVDVVLQLPPESDNAVNNQILRYNPVDEAHSFGKTYTGTLASRGEGRGFTFEYHLYEPEPPELFRGIQDGDLNSPGFTVEALLVLADGKAGLYTNPPCGKVAVETIIVPKVQAGEWITPVKEKSFIAELDFGSCGVGPFLRGDCNGDGQVAGQVTDAVYLLNFNFSGGPAPPCRAACDADGDGRFIGQVTDAVYLLGFSFLGGPPPPAPFPSCARSSRSQDIALGCQRPLGEGSNCR
jgi:hypothetical protein